MSADLIELVQRLGRPRVLVVGDLMLDRYVWGDAERISRASSVAAMLAALQADVSLVGVVGRDGHGLRIGQILDELRVDRTGVMEDRGRPTTVKERYMGRAQHKHPQQMLRVDYETREPVSGEVEASLCSAVAAEVGRADVVLVSDYDKGVC